MKTPFVSVLLVSLSSSFNLVADSLFDGKTLDGWDAIVEANSDVDPLDLFSVEDGSIHVYPKQIAGSQQPFGGIVTRESYENYHLKLEYKWGEKKFVPREGAVRDAGIVFHIVGEPVIWPTGVECQIQEGDVGDIWVIGQTRVSSPVHEVKKSYDSNGDLETRGAGLGGGRFARGDCWEVPGWNQVEVIVTGADAVYKVNGHVVNEVHKMRYRDDPNSNWAWKPLEKGKILLQAEGSELFYRNITIEKLP